MASNGAGPKPIPFARLTTDTLAEAVLFCLTPPARAAARAISEKMRRENGVQTAVESLHRHLPVADLTCDVLPDLAARWTRTPHKSKKGERPPPVKLSDEALNDLLQAGKLKMSDVEPYVTYPVGSRGQSGRCLLLTHAHPQPTVQGVPR